MDAVDNNKGGMFFVYGYSGTEKTYLYKSMLVALCSKGDIVLNVASSGIAALLLEGGRTAHSCYAIPINVVKDSMCHIAADSDLADLIRKATLIIWDEAPMINRHCDENEYESSDSVYLADEDSNFDDFIYTTEFLNGLRMSGIPNHSIKLKIGWFVFKEARIFAWTTICCRLMSKKQERIE
nr:ATP-dependent DNA helicase PIF4-like [Tanacetum cinerariifolium]